MHLFIWGHIFLQPWIFYTVLHFVWHFLWINVILQIVQMGIKGLVLVFMSLFPHFICYVITLLLLIKRNFLCPKKEENAL